MPGAKETILWRIRRSTRDVPEAERPEDVPVERGYRHEDDAPREEKIERFAESAENTVHGRITGHVRQSQCRPQLRVFGETDFSFAEDPILVPHPAEDRE